DTHSRQASKTDGPFIVFPPSDCGTTRRTRPGAGFARHCAPAERARPDRARSRPVGDSEEDGEGGELELKERAGQGWGVALSTEGACSIAAAAERRKPVVKKAWDADGRGAEGRSDPPTAPYRTRADISL